MKKKVLLVISVLLLVLLLSSYFLISSTIKIGADAEAAINSQAPSRYLADSANWKKWWPGEKEFTIDGATFFFKKPLPGVFGFNLLYKNDTLPGSLEIITESKNYCNVIWLCEMKASNNPIKRWIRYFQARYIKIILTKLADSLATHLTEKNVYGFIPVKTKVSDSVLIATRSSFDYYPNVDDIDKMKGKLQSYIQQQNAVEKSKPMLNVHQTGDGKYEVLLAIATDKLLQRTNEFEPKMVLKGGNILEAEFTGGPEATLKAFELFDTYKNDMEYTAPAIPYQLLVTDRTKEADTTKWVTKFYYPIF